MSNLPKKIEVLSNIAITVLAILLSIVLVKRFILPHVHTEPSILRNSLKQGERISLLDVNWSKKDLTVLLVLSKDCRFCTESAPFYQRLMKESQKSNKFSLIAVLPQTVSEGYHYLDSLGIAVDDVKQVKPIDIGATGTPTLILVDAVGRVVEQWVGKLPALKEEEVLRRLHVN